MNVRAMVSVDALMAERVSKREAARLVRRLFAAYPSVMASMDHETVRESQAIYVGWVMRWPARPVRVAIERAIRDSQRLPTIADLREHVDIVTRKMVERIETLEWERQRGSVNGAR